MLRRRLNYELLLDKDAFFVVSQTKMISHLFSDNRDKEKRPVRDRYHKIKNHKILIKIPMGIISLSNSTQHTFFFAGEKGGLFIKLKINFS